MKIDKIILRSETIVEVDFVRGETVRNYYSLTESSIIRLNRVSRSMSIHTDKIMSIGNFHLRVAMYPNKPDNYEPPF